MRSEQVQIHLLMAAVLEKLACTNCRNRRRKKCDLGFPVLAVQVGWFCNVNDEGRGTLINMSGSLESHIAQRTNLKT